MPGVESISIGSDDLSSINGTNVHQSATESFENDERKITSPVCFSIKFLIPGNLAGCLIGKRGQTINAIQASTGATIKLSQSRDFFPGTIDRVGNISGSPDSVNRAMSQVLRQLSGALALLTNSTAAESSETNITFNIILPMKAGGIMIGRGGETVKNLVEKTGARVQLANLKNCPVSTERLCSVAGSVQAVTDAMEIIIEKLAGGTIAYKYSHHKMRYINEFENSVSRSNSPVSDSSTFCPPSSVNPDLSSAYSNIAYHEEDLPYLIPRIMSHQQLMAPVCPSELMHLGNGLVQWYMSVPNFLVGAMIGKRGECILAIQEITNTHIQVTQKGDFIQGTSDRGVAITGPPYGVMQAQYIINQRLHHATSTVFNYENRTSFHHIDSLQPHLQAIY